MKDEPVVRIGLVTLYRGQMLFAIQDYLRIVSVLILSIYFLHVMTESEIAAAVRSMGIPFIVCYILGLSLRAHMQ